MNHTVYNRSLEELRAPFQEGSPVHKAGLRLNSLSWSVGHCSLYEEWKQTRADGK